LKLIGNDEKYTRIATHEKSEEGKSSEKKYANKKYFLKEKLLINLNLFTFKKNNIIKRRKKN
jgi:hypothetical protein